MVEFPLVSLKRIVTTDWSITQTKKALEQENELSKINIIWAASDEIALTASTFMKKKGLTQGKDIFICGIDWTTQGLSAIMSGELTTTVGGHFAEVGWAMILFYDYFNNIDFASEATVYKSPMKPLTAKNTHLILPLFNKDQWNNYNYTFFPKYLNPNLKQYRFDLVLFFMRSKVN